MEVMGDRKMSWTLLPTTDSLGLQRGRVKQGTCKWLCLITELQNFSVMRQGVPVFPPVGVCSA